jgi:8-oxo-dGTP pyrophosphatase MutT (NUDIX family)
MQPKHTDPPESVPAATLILVRQHRPEFQVYLLKRHAKSGFMAGHYVFPGGILDPDDWRFDVWKDHVDLAGASLTSRLGGGLTPNEIVAYGVAAIRELLEEAGIFLANRLNQGEQDLGRILRLRTSADLPAEWFLNLAVSEGWTLALSALSRWSHWITPLLMKRRYDTRFFLAFLPFGQRGHPDNREITHGIWIRPREALAENISGQIPLSPPTIVTLQEISKYATLGDLKQEVQARKWQAPNLPRLIPLEKGSVLIEPWDAQYHQSHIEIDAADLKDAILPAGEPFSRIWYDGRLYRPIKAQK